MTEHAAVIFVFFFLAEYASIVLICILTSILFLGGYLINITPLIYLYDVLLTINFSETNPINIMYYVPDFIVNNFISDLLSSIMLGIKASIMIFVFIWARASLPRIRFDQLMSFCWTVLLPIIVAFIIITPCILYCIDILPNNIFLL
jgi:NADH-ubiquinone oxidoreductase chain 1